MGRKFWFSRLLPLAGLLAQSACALATPDEGQPVAPGVAQATFEVRTNGTDLLPITVTFPADQAGRPLGQAHPALVFIQGGFVAPEQYAWQARHLAAQGYVVAMPAHLLDLAFFAVDNGRAAAELLASPPPSLLTGLVDPARIAVAGHSLGGVVAVKLALEGRFHALVLEASFPDAADDAQLPSLSLPSLSLAGTSDCSASLSQVKDGWAKLPAPTALVVLSGLTHYQFTADQTPDERRGCLPTGTLEEAHGRVATALTAFLNLALDGQTPGVSTFDAVTQADVQLRSAP
jgi:dienelactone hydrolase